jgi:2-iminobutanoate/2-iminopropanoate deaminase
VLIHYSDTAPKAIGPYCHATQIGDLIFCSGQTPLNPETNKLEGRNIGVQTERALRNLELILQDLGCSLQKVIKTTVFITTMDHFSEMNETYARCFGEHTPARTTVAVRSLPLGALVEIECIAVASDS